MTSFYKRSIAIVVAILFSLSFSLLAWAADFPKKTVQIVIPAVPGGPTDTTARIISKRLTDVLGQPTIVVNKPGGGMAIGIQSVLSAPPDGHTILNTELSIIMLPLLVKGISFSIKDFTIFNLATNAPLCVVVRKDAPWKSLEQLIADVKKNPDKITFSTAGPGSIARFAGELFQMRTGGKITHVPMNGAPAAVTALLGGQVDMSFMGFQVIKAHLEAGTLRGLAVLYPKRLNDYPEMPTTSEKGYPGMTATVWVGHFVPANTPPAISKKLGEVFQEVLKEKDVIGLLGKAGLLVENLGPEDAAKFVVAEQKKWSEVANTANIMPK